jgi:hypothetical protein
MLPVPLVRDDDHSLVLGMELPPRISQFARGYLVTSSIEQVSQRDIANPQPMLPKPFVSNLRKGFAVVVNVR